MRFLDLTWPSLLCLLILQGPAMAQQPKNGPPPALVEVARVQSGQLSPTALFVGTVTFPEISDVAAEVSGRVTTVAFDAGDQVKKGRALVRLDDALLTKEIGAVAASRDQARTEERKARLDSERYRKLLEQKAVSPQEHENFLYQQKALAEKVKSLSAQLDALEVQLEKKTVHAPFSGIILERRVDPGEWVDAGTPIATLGRNDQVDIRVNVPEEITALLHKGDKIRFETSAGTAEGALYAVIPQGDLKTRTFPVKIRARNDLNLLHGMEARIYLPAGPVQHSFIVPRDALISQAGKTTVFLIEDGSARPLPVEVTSYQGQRAGVQGDGLSDGALVVVKGNERLQPGQTVQILSQGQ